jgi:hypothetical protein
MQHSLGHAESNTLHISLDPRRRLRVCELTQLSSIRQEYHTSEAQRCRTEPREKTLSDACKRRCTASSLIRFRTHVS